MDSGNCIVLCDAADAQGGKGILCSKADYGQRAPSTGIDIFGKGVVISKRFGKLLSVFQLLYTLPGMDGHVSHTPDYMVLSSGLRVIRIPGIHKAKTVRRPNFGVNYLV